MGKSPKATETMVLGDFSALLRYNAHLSDRLQEVKMENKSLRGVISGASGAGSGGGGGRQTAGAGGEGAAAIYTTKNEIGYTIMAKISGRKRAFALFLPSCFT